MDMSPPSRANEELARFFSEKAESNAPLTPVEQAGVLQLMQQGTHTGDPGTMDGC